MFYLFPHLKINSKITSIDYISLYLVKEDTRFNSCKNYNDILQKISLLYTKIKEEYKIEIRKIDNEIEEINKQDNETFKKNTFNKLLNQQKELEKKRKTVKMFFENIIELLNDENISFDMKEHLCQQKICLENEIKILEELEIEVINKISNIDEYYESIKTNKLESLNKKRKILLNDKEHKLEKLKNLRENLLSIERNIKK